MENVLRIKSRHVSCMERCVTKLFPSLNFLVTNRFVFAFSYSFSQASYCLRAFIQLTTNTLIVVPLTDLVLTQRVDPHLIFQYLSISPS